MNTPGPLRAILMVGSSQLVNVAISIIRVKLVALLLGPSGVGLLGLFNSVKELASTAGGLGLATSGVRQIARESVDPAAHAGARQILLWSLTAQGATAALAIWLTRNMIAEKVFAGQISPDTLGFIAVAVWAGLVASAMTAIVQGMRRLSELVRITIFGSLLGTVFALTAIALFGASGLPLFVLALSIGQVLAAAWFFIRVVPRERGASIPLRTHMANWGEMVRLGLAFMLGAALSSAAMLMVRTLVLQQLGTDALGQFEAAWALTITYLGFALNAMAADYFPRLSGAINDRRAANEMINQQIQIGLVLGGPLILVMIGLAPIALALLYSSEFTDAVAVLQVMMLGNVFKLASWAMGFSVVAAGRGGLFALLEVNFNLWFVGLVWWQIDKLGLLAVGVAFVIAYCFYLIATQIAARHLAEFRWEKASLNLQAIYTAAAVALVVLVQFAPLAGALVSIIAAILGAVLGFRFLLVAVGTAHPIAARADRFFAQIGWQIRR